MKSNMTKTLKIYPDAEALVQNAAERITFGLEQVLKQKENASFVLTGGKIPEPVYRLLGAAPLAQKVDWNRVLFFWGDERCVPPDHPDSNFGMAWNALISKLAIPSEHIHRMKGELEDNDLAAQLYEKDLKDVFPGSGIPSFDLLLLGLGEDGHVASLFPGTHWDEHRLVVPNRMPETGAKRISMTPPILNEAQAVLFIVSGENKSKALAEVIQNPDSSLPAAKIHPEKGTLTWMVDHSAASLIRE